jgi:hypothetical protein
MYNFFLRFYDQTDEKVEECVAKLKTKSKCILGHKVENNGQSMNWGKAPSHTVNLKFINERTATSVMVGNKTMQDIYMQYANGGGEPTTFNQRGPGQAVWQH